MAGEFFATAPYGEEQQSCAAGTCDKKGTGKGQKRVFGLQNQKLKYESRILRGVQEGGESESIRDTLAQKIGKLTSGLKKKKLPTSMHKKLNELKDLQKLVAAAPQSRAEKTELGRLFEKVEKLERGEEVSDDDEEMSDIEGDTLEAKFLRGELNVEAMKAERTARGTKGNWIIDKIREEQGKKDTKVHTKDGLYGGTDAPQDQEESSSSEDEAEEKTDAKAKVVEEMKQFEWDDEDLGDLPPPPPLPDFTAFFKPSAPVPPPHFAPARIPVPGEMPRIRPPMPPPPPGMQHLVQQPVLSAEEYKSIEAALARAATASATIEAAPVPAANAPTEPTAEHGGTILVPTHVRLRSENVSRPHVDRAHVDNVKPARAEGEASRGKGVLPEEGAKTVEFLEFLQSFDKPAQ